MLKYGDASKSGIIRRAISAAIASSCAAVTILCLVLMLYNYPGMNIAFFIALGFTLVVFAYLFLRKLSLSEKHSRLATALKRCFVICLAVGITGFLILQALILSGAHTQDAEVDCIIVLGAGIYGETPSRILASRLDSALAYVIGRESVPIIVAGGQGPGESISEAEAMYRYLTRRGADEAQIWKEDKSTSTLENLAFSLALMEEKGLDIKNATIAIVTNEFHLFRAKHIAGTLGLDAIGVSAQTPYPTLRVLYHFREAVALLKYFLSSGSV